MSDITRQNQIMEILNEEKSVSVSTLIKRLYVSPATIRRDLEDMAKKGLLKRVHGGAILFASKNEESSIITRSKTMVQEKRAIAASTINFLKNNQSIFLDSSSTVCALVPYLNDFKYLTLITNSLTTAIEIGEKTDFKVFVPSGFVKRPSNSLLGDATNQILSDLHCDLFIFSAAGMDTRRGITEASIEQAETKKIMMRNAETRILLLDHSKFGQSFLAKSCDLADVDILVTDQQPNEEFMRYLSRYSNLQIVY